MEWWRNAAIYQIYPRSFQDSNDDGTGDLAGIISRLDYLSELGIDCLWLSPFYPSPNKDFGYDISDYCAVDQLFGTMADFDLLLAEAHKRSLRVIIDLVPNHTSDQHPWFVQARSDKLNNKRDWYIWHDGAAGGGVPNNWTSYFGGPAWTLDESSGQYYLHQFLPEQPDLNFRNADVVEAMLEVMHFWLKRGVDGFRVDVIWLLVEAADFADEPINPDWKESMIERARFVHTKIEDQPETHEVIVKMRQVLDQYSGPGNERMMIGEVYLPYEKLITYYGSAGRRECHMPFNFHLITDALNNWNAETVQRVVEEYLAILPGGETANWVLGNHDQFRFASRIGSEQARIATMLLLTLPGSPTLYYGDEIGMINGVIPVDKIVDPRGLRQPEVPEEQRDPERTPMQWDDTRYSGFSKSEPWLPVNNDFKERNVKLQEQQTGSMLKLVKKLLSLRKEWAALREGTYHPHNCQDGVFTYARQHEAEKIAVILNFTGEERSTNLTGKVLASTRNRADFRATAESDQRHTIILQGHEGLILLL